MSFIKNKHQLSSKTGDTVDVVVHRAISAVQETDTTWPANGQA